MKTWTSDHGTVTSGGWLSGEEAAAGAARAAATDQARQEAMNPGRAVLKNELGRIIGLARNGRIEKSDPAAVAVFELIENSAKRAWWPPHDLSEAQHQAELQQAAQADGARLVAIKELRGQVRRNGRARARGHRGAVLCCREKSAR